MGVLYGVYGVFCGSGGVNDMNDDDGCVIVVCAASWELLRVGVSLMVALVIVSAID